MRKVEKEAERPVFPATIQKLARDRHDDRQRFDHRNEPVQLLQNATTCVDASGEQMNYNASS